LEVSFTGSNSTDDNSVSSYSWNFKNGASSSNANPTQTFTAVGTYVVELTVQDENGLSDTANVTITVNQPTNNAPVAVASATPITGNAPLQVQFVGSNSTDDNAITSYYWNFADDPSSAINPVRTFNTPGVYVVTLTVSDAAGLTSTASVTITVNSGSGGGGSGAPPGFYVTPNGSAYSNGLTEATAWSLEHAFDVAKSGDIIYVKSGSYGNKQLLFKNQGFNGSPIKFIGYTNNPGDLVSSQGSTFNYGESVNPNKMPLLSGSNGQGIAIILHESNIQMENFQITGYGTGIQTINLATDIVLKNVIITNLGTQTVYNAYDGFGFDIRGNNALLENCFVLNATAEAIKLFDSDYSRVNYCQVWADNPSNPTDYYFLLTGGTNNSIVENSYADRAPGLQHGGHGFVMKDLAEYNTIRNCTSRRTNFELNFAGVRYNTMEDCSIYGVSTGAGDWHAVMVIFNGANNNLIKNMYIQDTWTAITWADDDDGYIGPGGDRDEVSCGYDNTFDGITVNNTNSVLRVGGGQNFAAIAQRNTFVNSNFSNFNTVAVTYYGTEDIKFKDSSFSNGNVLYVETGGIYAPYSYFDVSFENCSWTNVNFTPPN